LITDDDNEEEEEEKSACALEQQSSDMIFFERSTTADEEDATDVNNSFDTNGDAAESNEILLDSVLIDQMKSTQKQWQQYMMITMQYELNSSSIIPSSLDSSYNRLYAFGMQHYHPDYINTQSNVV